MAAEVVGAAGVAGATAVAAGAFGYNRENFKWDADNRWERFTSGREYANQQAEQYRADIRSMAALTMKKTSVWCVMSSLTMALCVALYCAGRLGLHGPSPPAWIMGLWLTNNAAAFAYMALCMFLAMHSGFRAQAASTQLLTRKIRVPVPTLSQLDSARRFSSEFEQQSPSDIFRVPLVTNTGVPQTDDAVYPSDGNSAQGSSARSRSAPPGRRAATSSWIRQEFETDRTGPVTKGDKLPLPADTAPEHFRLWAAVQKEYYEYDVYARICIFMGFVHYVQALCYYGLGHINIELRAFWVAYATVIIIATLQALLLRFDIIPQNPNKKEWLPYCQFLGPLAIFPAAVAMSIDFQVKFDTTSITICWILIFIAYTMQLLYSLRLLEVILPDRSFSCPGERLGASWLPEGWKTIPSSFYHVLYFVAPPTKLQSGQHDIVREIKEGGVGAHDEVMGYDNEPVRLGQPDPIEGTIFANSKHVRPWKLVARLTAVLPASWAFLIVGTICDVIVGEQGFVTAPHWSRPPMTRLSLEPHELGTPLGFPWAAGDEPFIPEQMAWHEEKRHAGEYNIRRLQQGQATLSDALENLVAAISSADKVAAVQADAEHISWPGFFEPKVMACGQEAAGNMVAALTPRGFGAMARVGHGGKAVAEPFRLSGLTHWPALLGASLGLEDGDGLLTVSRGGHVAACPGPRPEAGGVWACSESESLPQLPVAEGSMLNAAAAAFLPAMGGSARRLHAALVVDSAPDLVGLFVHEAGSWLPLGEMQVPGSQSASLSFVGGGDLLVATKDHVLRRNVHDGKVIASVANAHMSEAQGGTIMWQASCGLPGQDGDVAHLHLSRAPTSRAWRPEVVAVKVLKSAAAELPAFFN